MHNHGVESLATPHAADTASCMSVSHLSVPCMSICSLGGYPVRYAAVRLPFQDFLCFVQI